MMNNVVSINKGGFGGESKPGPGAADFRPRTILQGDRFRELDSRESYYLCTQHDAKTWDFDGRSIAGPKAIQPLISAEKSPQYIPLKMRRPAAPVRMGKIIVDSFTNLLFGENRFPKVGVDGTDGDFAETLVRVGRLPMQMIRARNLGGSVGTVGLSWCFHEGVPRFEVHNAKNLYVHSWIDRVLLLPKHVTEVYTFYKVKWDGKGFNKHYYWFRRDWTPDGDFVFEDVPYEKDADPVWRVDEEKSNRHGDGVVHFEWIQNLPSDEIDGIPDYEGLYDSFDQYDILNSVIVRGAILNLDPTLKLKMNPELLKRRGIRKGSDNALIVGKDGDAEYMELSGTSITAGTELLQHTRRSILETAQCIVPDPSEVAAQGVSSVAIKAMFAPMISKADVLREQYAAAMKRAIENMIEVAKSRLARTELRPVYDEAGEPALDAYGEPMMEEVSFVLRIPPRIEQVPQTETDPETGAEVEATDPETGEPITVATPIPRVPEEGGEVTLVWPPYFAPTYDDQGKVATAMQVAAGGKAFLSIDAATEIAAAAFGLDPTEEKKRVAATAQATAAAEAEMFPDTGGGEEPPGNFGINGERGSAAPFGEAPDAPPYEAPKIPDPVVPPVVFVPEE